MASKKSKIFWRKKPTPCTIFRYFRIESQNNKSLAKRKKKNSFDWNASSWYDISVIVLTVLKNVEVLGFRVCFIFFPCKIR